MRLLLIEDNQALAEAICIGMRALEHNIDTVNSAEHAEMELKHNEFDAILLDINLPKKSGFDLLQTIRSQSITTPVIVLTARDTKEDKILGLDLGADDYLVKPFELDELNARLRAIVRRSMPITDNVMTFGDLQLNIDNRTVHIDQQLFHLARKEYNLLHILMQANGKVVTMHAIESKMYSWDEDISSNSVQVHISNLRKKIGKNRIKTITGIGYQLTQES